MNDAEQAKAKSLCDKATTGPWGVSGQHGYTEVGPSHKGPQGESTGWCRPCLTGNARGNDNVQHDSAFAAGARTLLPAALKLITELKAELAMCHEVVKQARDLPLSYGSVACFCDRRDDDGKFTGHRYDCPKTLKKEAAKLLVKLEKR